MMGTLKKNLLYILLGLFSVMTLSPIVWAVINSFKSEQEYAINPFGLPSQWHWQNYADAWEVANLGTFFWNSIVITVVAAILTVFIGALASYFLARFNFKMRKWIQLLFLFGMLIPIHATLVPMFLLMRDLGLLDTRISLILPYVAFHLPITIFILVGFMTSFSKEVEESAIMDGCGVFRIFWSIILPMSRPALATVTILNFIYNWNEYLFALVLINDSSLKTIPLGLASFAGEFTTNYTLQMAALIMSLIPTLIFYLLMEKNLVKGMTAGAVKG